MLTDLVDGLLKRIHTDRWVSRPVIAWSACTTMFWAPTGRIAACVKPREVQLQPQPEDSTATQVVSHLGGVGPTHG